MIQVNNKIESRPYSQPITKLKKLFKIKKKKKNKQL